MFQVNLPAAWNGRSVQFGGGGFNGSLITGLGLPPAAPYEAPGPLARGYVTVGTDSGHQTRPGMSPMAFALNDEMLVNFAHAAYPKVRNVSVELMKKAYGSAPAKLYFMGSSEGGREALTMAQRYPTAFDGIFSRVPVIHWTGLQFAGTRAGAATFGEAWLSPTQVKLFHDRQLAACDALDGLADGVISNVDACRQRFQPRQLLCKPGARADACLSDAKSGRSRYCALLSDSVPRWRTVWPSTLGGVLAERTRRPPARPADGAPGGQEPPRQHIRQRCPATASRGSSERALCSTSARAIPARIRAAWSPIRRALPRASAKSRR